MSEISISAKSIPGLQVVATPLGNPGDFSSRAREALEQADAVLAEDTRRAGLLCSRCGLNVRRFISCHNFNEQEKLPDILNALKKGERLALISDAGMPVLADPGYRLVRACRQEGIPVTVIPGPCAAVTALVGSGIPPQPFVFFGFLPRGAGDIAATLERFSGTGAALVFYERKDRLEETLRIALEKLGDREVCVARELTKIHEEYILFRLSEGLPKKEILGELTVIIGPSEKTERTSESEAVAILEEEVQSGGTPKAAAKRAQKRVSGWSARELYALLVARS
ncbi:MAG: 16S rRNA (cytidine(1402)-2'-O)-methyltransferase [Desulfovibrionaceae bacterium]|nr:16S rRNA (cytidine(1402)-2'-O)-methyltransferase [Desulfovibrionaceae bacterium]